LDHVDLFSGIGGFALASRWAGIRTVQFVENETYCQKVLRKNFPGIPIHDDIEDFDAAQIFQPEKQGRHPVGGEIAGRSELCGAGTALGRLGGMAYGIPGWLDEPGDIPRVTSGQKDRVARLKGLGNAVVPQVAYEIIKAMVKV
jgi:hypothetical protein